MLQRIFQITRFPQKDLGTPGSLERTTIQAPANDVELDATDLLSSEYETTRDASSDNLEIDISNHDPSIAWLYDDNTSYDGVMEDFNIF